MDIIIREAKFEDVQGVAKVYIDAWNTTYKGIIPDEYLKTKNYQSQEERWRKRYFENKDTKEILYVAVDKDNSIVGFACGTTSNDDVDFDGTISTIYIIESYQRKGIGRELVKKLVERLTKAGAQKMIIWAIEENPSCGFYERLGGNRTRKKSVNFGGKELIEIGFTWNNLNQMLSVM